MNVYSLINSKDISKYLQNINYEFSSLEYAWLIWQSNKLTITQRHKAWEDIITNMPDCQIPQSPHRLGMPSLKDYLRDLIDAQKTAQNDFFKSEANIFYNGEINGKGFSGWDPTAFASFEACIEHLDSYQSDPQNVLRYRVTKFKLVEDTYVEEYTVIFDCNMQMREIETRYFTNIFNTLYFNFPVPFQKGDILMRVKNETTTIAGAVPSNEKVVYLSHGSEKSPYLLTYEDMTLNGYFWYFDGVKSDSEPCYLDFEFAKEKLVESDRFLTITSAFLREELNVAEYAEMYHLIKVDIDRECKTELYDRLSSL